MKYIVLTIVGFLAATPGCSQATGDDPLALSKTITLEGVSGRIDHMSLDAQGKRLFVAALGNNTVEVIDLEAARRAGTIRELSEPQGVLFVPEFNRIVVANGGDGSVRFYDGKTFQHINPDFPDTVESFDMAMYSLTL